MNVFALFQTRVADALKALHPEITAEALSRIVVEPPRDAGHGDLSTNAAMVVAKPLGKSPREVAAAIAARFAGDPDVAAADVAGPGFINFRLNDPIWFAALRSIGELGENYGRSNVG